MSLKETLHRLNVGRMAVLEEEIQRGRLQADGRTYLRTGERHEIAAQARAVLAGRRELRRLPGRSRGRR